MSTKLLLAAVPLLFLGSAVMAADIVYDNDWRAGETGFIHHPHECGWHHHHYRTRTVSGVTYYDSAEPGVVYDTEYAPNETVYDTEYTPDYYGPDDRFGVRYDGDREWHDGRRDFDRREFRDERFHDRDGVGAGVSVGGHEGVDAGARVDHRGVGAGVHVNGHGVGVGVGGDTGVDVHAR